MTDLKTLVREWAQTTVVLGAAVAAVWGIVWALARRNVDAGIFASLKRAPNVDEWIVGALERKPAQFREVSGEVWKMDIERWERAFQLAKETRDLVDGIADDVTHLAERDEQFGTMLADVSQLKRESEQQVELLSKIVADVARTRESVARIEGALETPRRRRDD